MKSGWEASTLGKICNIYNGNSINAEYKKQHFTGLAEGYPFIATKDIDRLGEVNYDNGVRIPFDTNYKVALPGSVFICAEGGSAGKKMARVRQKVCFGNKLFCLYPRKGLSGDFLYYYLGSDAFQSQFKEKLSGLIGGVSAKKFHSIIINHPSLEEQQRIVLYLDDTFAKIDELEKSARREYFQSVALLQTHLSNTLFHNKSWKSKTLGELSIIKGDYGLNVPSKPFDGVRYLRITDITELGHLNDELVSADLSGDESQIELKEGDILFARTGATVGKTLLYHESYGKCLFAGYLIRYRLNLKELLPKFLFYITHSDEYYQWVMQNQKAAAQPNISAKKYNSLEIEYPSIEEQYRIVESLDVLFEKILTLRSNLDIMVENCKEMKLAILREVFD